MRDVIVQLFQWSYVDVARECCSFLGPHRVGAVQLSPSVEQIKGNAWYHSYWPVSYKLDNRLGNESQFAFMCDECRKCGVDIYVDAVFNHMGAGDDSPARAGVGSAGTAYRARKRVFGLFGPNDFHHRPGTNFNCKVSNYISPANVQECDLLGMADLNTSLPSVRAKQIELRERFRRLGAKGARIDAAKHIAPKEVAAIVESALTTWGYDNVYQEVIPEPLAPAGLRPRDYVASGRVTAFDYGGVLAEAFRASNLVELSSLISTAPHGKMELASHQALVFVSNHDTERNRILSPKMTSMLTYEDGMLYGAAEAFSLAFSYGRPRVMSSFRVDPRGEPYVTIPMKSPFAGGESVCGEQDSAWVCQHRWALVANMVAWREAAGAAPIENWQNGSTKGQVAFSRGGTAFIAFSLPLGTLWSASLQTGLPQGCYCQMATNGCKLSVTVGADGVADILVGSDRVPVFGLHRNAMSPDCSAAAKSIEKSAERKAQHLDPSMPRRLAWVTLTMGNSRNQTGTLQLQKRTIDKYSSGIDHVIMMSSDVRKDTEELLAAGGSRIIRVSSIPNPPKLRNLHVRSEDAAKLLSTTWSLLFTKFFVFNLTEYGQVVYMDSDAYLIREVLAPYDPFSACGLASFCAVRDNMDVTPYGHPLLNGGVLVVRPNATRLKNMLASFATYDWHPETTAPDQIFFADYYALNPSEGGVRFISAAFNFGCTKQNAPTPDGKELGFRSDQAMPSILHLCGARKLPNYPMCDSAPLSEGKGEWPCDNPMGRTLQAQMVDANPCLPYAGARTCHGARVPRLFPTSATKNTCHWCGEDIGCYPSSQPCLFNTNATRAALARLRGEMRRKTLGIKEFEA